MTIFFSKTAHGFFDSEIHTTIPDDVVEISAAYHKELIEGQSSEKTIGANENGYPVLVDVVPAARTAQENKEDAMRRLAATDWVNQPDVYDPLITPHLTNRDAFIAYRAQVRAIVVNPAEGNLTWPVEPIAVWAD